MILFLTSFQGGCAMKKENEKKTIKVITKGVDKESLYEECCHGQVARAR